MSEKRIMIPTPVIPSDEEMAAIYAAQEANPNRNSSRLWLPQITTAGLPVPHTIVIPYNHHKTLSIFDGEQSAEFDRLILEVDAAAREIGLPAFLRTDLGSAKHGGPSAYLVTGEDTVNVLGSLLEDQELKFWTDRSPTRLLVRQFLELEASFIAFGGLPISREWRFFADREGVKCFHPYWPEDAIEFYSTPEPEGWREQLAELHAPPANLADLKAMAVEAATVCGGEEWSVDIARDASGKWWLIDMATAGNSFHWPGCERTRRAM